MIHSPASPTKPPLPDPGVALPSGDLKPAEPDPKRPVPRYAAFERRKHAAALPTEPVATTAAPELPKGASLRTWLVVVATGIVLGGCLIAYIAPGPAEGNSPAVSVRPGPSGTSSNVVQRVTPAAPVVSPQLAQATSDTTGRPTRIVGSDPGSVLGLFCAAGGSVEPRMPIGVRQAPVPRRGIQLGVLRLGADPTELAIWIRYDQRTGKWIAGNGRDPISAQPLLDNAR